MTSELEDKEWPMDMVLEVIKWAAICDISRIPDLATLSKVPCKPNFPFFLRPAWHTLFMHTATPASWLRFSRL